MMPKDYEQRKRKLIARGMSRKAAKRQAAIQTAIARKKQGKPPARYHR